jgi:hypothetical protein
MIGRRKIAGPVVAPLDEFFSQIISERRALFALALGFVIATLPLAFWLGSLMARSMRELARQTDEIQRFQIADRPRLRSMIDEIDELGSVFTMQTSSPGSFAAGRTPMTISCATAPQRLRPCKMATTVMHPLPTSPKRSRRRRSIHPGSGSGSVPTARW